MTTKSAIEARVRVAANGCWAWTGYVYRDYARVAGKLAHRSARMARLMKIYLRKRAEFLEAFPLCAVGRDHARGEVHHMAGRVGDLLLNDELWLPVCRQHHREITENPAWALEQGYSLPRIGRAS